MHLFTNTVEPAIRHAPLRAYPLIRHWISAFPSRYIGNLGKRAYIPSKGLRHTLKGKKPVKKAYSDVLPEASELLITFYGLIVPRLTVR
jgi:hypothetical protein